MVLVLKYRLWKIFIIFHAGFYLNFVLFINFIIWCDFLSLQKFIFVLLSVQLNKNTFQTSQTILRSLIRSKSSNSADEANDEVEINYGLWQMFMKCQGLKRLS